MVGLRRRESRELKKVQVDIRRFLGNELSSEFTEGGGEFEAMAGESGDEVDEVIIGKGVDDKVFVGGHGVVAAFGLDEGVGVR